MAVEGVNLQVRSGEILGIAAVEGNGQSELVEAIAGMRQPEKGDVYICGKRATGMDPRKVRKLGLAHIPEDRIATGAGNGFYCSGEHDDRQRTAKGICCRRDKHKAVNGRTVCVRVV